jgi:hypothetical protein
MGGGGGLKSPLKPKEAGIFFIAVFVGLVNSNPMVGAGL